MEKQFSEKEMDMRETYTNKAVQEHVSTSFSAYGLVCTVPFLFFILLYFTLQETLTSSLTPMGIKNMGRS